jgi:hypothetical protein
MLNKRLAICLIALLLLGAGCVKKERPSYSAPLLLPETTREMRSPGFWTSRHSSADMTVLDAPQIRTFNEHIRKDLKLTRDITGVGETFPGEELLIRVRDSLTLFSNKTYYLAASGTADKTFLLRLEKNMWLSRIQAVIEVRYGLTNGYADQRVLPVEEGLYENQGDIFFDKLQNSSLDMGTPLAVLHESEDGEWLYAIGPSSDGWVEKKKVSLFTRGELKEYLEHPDFCVVVSPRADIFLDPGLTVYHDSAGMGARFPLGRITDSRVAEIVIPYRDLNGRSFMKKAYVKKESVNIGNLPYTPRNILDQAFKLIDAPYSWGGAYGEQDCSGFLQQVFATTGIFLPRNSSAQAEAGVLLGGFEKQAADEEKIEILSGKAAGGVTLIYMDGHVMLFLGMYEGKPYVIHDIWGYRERGRQGDEARIISRVSVTGLNLGKDTSSGSLLRRILSISNISAK